MLQTITLMLTTLATYWLYRSIEHDYNQFDSIHEEL